MIEVDIRIVRFGKTETFFHRMSSLSMLDDHVSYFESQVGTVLAVMDRTTQNILWEKNS
jgi:hypothetical protein